MGMELVFVGNAVREPRMATTRGGKVVCNFDFAVNRMWKGADGQKKAIFIQMSAWGATAESCNKNIVKGKKLVVYCNDMEVDTYIGNDNAPHAQIKATVERFEYLTAKGDEDAGEAPGAPQNKPMQQDNAQEGFVAVDDDELPF